MRTTVVMFRGEERVVIVDFDGGYEPDTNAHVIEWHFEDEGLEPTDDELDQVYQQLVASSGEDDD